MSHSPSNECRRSAYAPHQECRFPYCGIRKPGAFPQGPAGGADPKRFSDTPPHQDEATLMNESNRILCPKPKPWLPNELTAWWKNLPLLRIFHLIVSPLPMIKSLPAKRQRGWRTARVFTFQIKTTPSQPGPGHAGRFHP